jgi:hypothetical protein
MRDCCCYAHEWKNERNRNFYSTYGYSILCSARAIYYSLGAQAWRKQFQSLRSTNIDAKSLLMQIIRTLCVSELCRSLDFLVYALLLHRKHLGNNHSKPTADMFTAAFESENMTDISSYIMTNYLQGNHSETWSTLEAYNSTELVEFLRYLSRKDRGAVSTIKSWFGSNLYGPILVANFYVCGFEVNNVFCSAPPFPQEQVAQFYLCDRQDNVESPGIVRSKSDTPEFEALVRCFNGDSCSALQVAVNDARKTRMRDRVQGSKTSHATHQYQARKKNANESQPRIRSTGISITILTTISKKCEA